MVPDQLSWRQRARAIGLRQRSIAAMLGCSERWISASLGRPVPAPRIRLVITAWEVMTPSQRGEWLFRVGLGALCWRQPIATPGEDLVVCNWPELSPERIDPG
ncbi:MAG: hypothetical protein IVW56_09415, partial [Candidatus Binataceae bacterium]|nr:hypothetical protein [Candidatus Binataceae bacterium]